MMGLYDYIECEYPLPGKEIDHSSEFQTKSLCFDVNGERVPWLKYATTSCEKYKISKCGRFQKRSRGIKNRQLHVPYDPQGLCFENMPITGRILFYNEGYTYEAFFVDGKIKNLVSVDGDDADCA